MYASLKRIATDAGMKVLADGANVEDFQDFRPGHQAAAEWDVRHPLKEAGMNKEDIRRFSKEMDLPTWDKPAFACLASRFPYGEALDETKLRRVADAESVLKEMGFRVFRVRSHGDLARIELAEEEMNRAYDAREEINTRMKNVGFTWVSMDLAGFRSGSMNESLSTQAVKRTENNKG